MKKILLISGVVLLIFIVSFGYYFYQLSPVSSESKKIEVVIPQGSSGSSIADLLSKKGLIRNADVFKLYLKVYNVKGLNYGKYILNTNMDVPKIIKTLQGKPVADKIVISFIEGYDIPKIAKKIADSTNNTEEDVYALLKDESYLDELIAEYWFIKSDIKNDKLYYPLEGYLFPDTYFFENKDVTVKEIFEVMLDETNKQLKPFKEAIAKTDFTIHEFLTFASIVELEGASSDDRASVAGVLYNRLEDGWTLGSDVTGYYGAKMDDWTDGLGIHLNDCNDYNTRGTCVPKLPISPIANPGIESITAVIKPTKHDYYYFVADCDGKTYLNYTEREHLNTISKLKSEDNWCDV